MEKIDIESLKGVMTYAEYLAKTISLLNEGKTSTTEVKPNPKIHEYTQQNVERMQNLDISTVLSAETRAKLATITAPQTWLTISEGWCGDASQIVPVLEQMTATNPNITHRLIFRDEHLDIMDAFLTEGGRSIPKTVILDNNGKVLNAWGPRPSGLQIIVDDLRQKMNLMSKEEQKAYFEDVKLVVHNWYNADKTAQIQREFTAIL